MKNLLKVALVAAAFVLAAGCSSQPKQAPAQPTVTETSPEMTTTAKKGKKHHRKGKMGQTNYEKDMTK